MIRILALLLALTPPFPLPGQQTPASVLESLLNSERTFSSRATVAGCQVGLYEMLREDVTIPVYGRGLVHGRNGALAELGTSAGFASATCQWSPLRSGISADGTQGFTYGYLTERHGDGTVLPFRYLAYWVRDISGWRVVVYKRLRSPVAVAVGVMRAPALPSAWIAPHQSAPAQAAIEATLAEAERTFSREAQTLGLGPAFAKHGAPDAMNLGGESDTSFTFGPEAIATRVTGGDTSRTSPVSWGADRVIAASSGDLGVTMGMIFPNATTSAAGGRQGIPFFTIWRRGKPGEPWRYIAE